MEKMLAWMKNHRDIVIYLVFGVLTTAVNYIVYLPCYNILGFSAAFSNLIAWIFAVIFAYLTNKPFVFCSNDWSINTVIPELGKFVGSRLFSGGVETAIIYLTVDVLLWNGNIMKLVVSVLVVILNYIASKLFVFRSKS